MKQIFFIYIEAAVKRGNLNSLNHKMSKKANEMFFNHQAELVNKMVYSSVRIVTLTGIMQLNLAGKILSRRNKLQRSATTTKVGTISE